MSSCRVCGAPLGPAVYESAPPAITSLAGIVASATVVHVCSACGHTQTRPLDDLDRYYGEQYRLLDASIEDDDLYDIVDGEAVYRAAHQATTVVARVPLAAGARVLDFGAAKAATLRQLAAVRPDLSLHAFEVSDAYRRFWADFLEPDHTAVVSVPDDWAGRFDVVLSFFVLEHVADPVADLRTLRAVLAPGGWLWALVPDVAANPADLIVVDHVNHFTPSSLEAALASAGFDEVTIDRGVHHSACAVLARRGDGPTRGPSNADLAADVAMVTDLAATWRRIRDRVDVIATELADTPVALYGAGAWGAYVLTRFESVEVRALVDRNPHVQGTVRHGVSVVGPADLDPAIEDVVVALNPRIARDAMADVSDWAGRGLRLHYLDG